MNQWIESNEIKSYLYGKLSTVQEISNDTQHVETVQTKLLIVVVELLPLGGFPLGCKSNFGQVDKKKCESGSFSSTGLEWKNKGYALLRQ